MFDWLRKHAAMRRIEANKGTAEDIANFTTGGCWARSQSQKGRDKVNSRGNNVRVLARLKEMDNRGYIPDAESDVANGLAREIYAFGNGVRLANDGNAPEETTIVEEPFHDPAPWLHRTGLPTTVKRQITGRAEGRQMMDSATREIQTLRDLGCGDVLRHRYLANTERSLKALEEQSATGSVGTDAVRPVSNAIQTLIAAGVKGAGELMARLGQLNVGRENYSKMVAEGITMDSRGRVGGTLDSGALAEMQRQELNKRFL